MDSACQVRFSAFNERAEVHVARHHLPHWTQEGCTYFVTFHLGDSIPVSQLMEWRRQRDIWLGFHPQPWSRMIQKEYDERFGARIDEWLDAGSGGCPLRRPALRDAVEASLLHFDGQRHDLDAYVIMPNHVHVLTKPRTGYKLFVLLKGIKGGSARTCNLLLGNTGSTFWMEDSYNRIVRDAEELRAFRSYISANPEKAALRAREYTLVMRNVLITDG